MDEEEEDELLLLLEDGEVVRVLKMLAGLNNWEVVLMVESTYSFVLLFIDDMNNEKRERERVIWVGLLILGK